MKHIAKSASIVAFGTTISRILGYFRDMLVAHFFGAGIFADAFYAAYRIPNLLRRLLGEGAVSSAVIPVLSEYHATKTAEETKNLANVLFTALAIILSVVVLSGIFFSKSIVEVIAYGFTDTPEKLGLTVSLTKLMFPFLFFISLSAVALGILNTLGKFFVPAVASSSLSISEIGFMLAIAPLLSPENQIRGLAISVLIGGAGQFLIQLPALIKQGFKIRPNFNFLNPGLKRITSLMLPTTMGISVDQINSFVDTICASFLPLGSMTALYYSNRLMQLPLAVFAIAVATVSLPAMSAAAAKKDIGELKNTVNYAVRLLLYALIPSMFGLMIFGLPIIKLLFESGRFGHDASLTTFSALFFYSAGLPAYGIVKIFASAFYAFKETKTPVKIAAFAMIINALLNVLLMFPLKVGGLALATAAASYFNAFWLFITLRRKIGHIGARGILTSLLKILFASGLMCALTWLIFFKYPVDKLIGLPLPSKLISFLSIFFAVGCYIFLTGKLKLEEYEHLKKSLTARFLNK